MVKHPHHSPARPADSAASPAEGPYGADPHAGLVEGQSQVRKATFGPGEVLAGRFRIERFIAQGGAGEVYEAEDLELRVTVALKVVRPEIADNEQAIERFRREIQLARQVTHANVCRIFDVFRHEIPDSREGYPPRRFLFLTMELLKGETLAGRLHRRGPIPTAEALAIVEGMALGLAAAHQAGVVHRDFKSANVVLVPQNGGYRVVITDFGLARGEVASEPFPATITQSGTVVGTPTYMAPEQLTGGEITPAVDTYALGIVMYEMVTGLRPFKGETDLSTAVKRLTEVPASPRVHVPDIDPRWERTILRCLERAPEDRFARLDDLVAALRSSEVGEQPAAAAIPPNPAATGAPQPPADDLSKPGSSLHPPTASAAPPAAGAAAIPPKPQPAATTSGRSHPRLRLLMLAVLLATAVVAGFALSNVTSSRATPPPEVELAASRSGRPAIAVLEFKNLARSDSDDWMSVALQEMVNMELAAGGQLQPVLSESVNQAVRELELGSSGGLSAETVFRLRQLLGAHLVVDGSYLTSGGQLRLHLRLHGHGEAPILLTLPGRQDQLFDLVSEAGAAVREKLGLVEYLGRRESPGANPEAAQRYRQGIEALRRFDSPQARSLFEETIEADPIHAAAYSGLAGAWALLGYRDRAIESGIRAVDLAAPLSREQRIAIEAEHSLRIADWERATELFRSLHGFFPENLDYGLGLARAEAEAGRAGAAFATVEALRGLERGAEDGRIDLVEALAAERAGDPERQLRAARQALTKGEEAGAELLRAESRLFEARALAALNSLVEAQNAATAAQRTFTEAEVPRGIAESLRLLAEVRELRGDASGADRLRERAAGIEAGLALG